MRLQAGRWAMASLCLCWSFVALGADLNDETAKLSYTFGMDIGNSIKQQGQELDLELMFQAIRDVYEGRETKLTLEEATAVRQAYIQRRQQEVEAEREAAVARNKTEGEAFLAKNAKADGVKVTESGLQYMIINPGSSKKPQATDRVTVHYRGKLLNGTEFDSSYSRGEPTTFPLNGVIPGWTEGLQLIGEGGKVKLFIPSELAYGERGAGAAIGPNSTLIFEVELISIDGAQ